MKKGFFKSLTGNIREGAGYISEKFKERSAKAYVAGTEIVDETNDKIHTYTEKQILLKERHTLEGKQEELIYAFGRHTLTHYLEEGALDDTFLTGEAVGDIVAQFKGDTKRLEAIDENIEILENK